MVIILQILIYWRAGLTDLQRQLEGRPGRFSCLAGYKYFFVDWHLQVSPWLFQARTLGPLEEIPRLAPIRDGCQAWATCSTPITSSPWPLCWRSAIGCEAEIG